MKDSIPPSLCTPCTSSPYIPSHPLPSLPSPPYPLPSLSCPRERQMKERLSLQSSLQELRGELHSAHRHLDCEAQWKGSAELKHRQLLAERTELQSRWARDTDTKGWSLPSTAYFPFPLSIFLFHCLSSFSTVRLMEAEDSLREKEQALQEVQTRLRSMERENLMLEERNKLLAAVH